MKWIRVFATMMAFAFIAGLVAPMAMADRKPTAKRINRDAAQLRLVKMVDVGVMAVDTPQCVCDNKMAPLDVMVPKTVRVRAFNSYTQPVQVKVELEFRRLNKGVEKRSRTVTIDANRSKWVNFFNSPGFYIRSKGLKATISLTARPNVMRDNNMSNNTIKNDHCLPYVE